MGERNGGANESGSQQVTVKKGSSPARGGRLAVIQEEEEQSEIKVNEQLQA